MPPYDQQPFEWTGVRDWLVGTDGAIDMCFARGGRRCFVLLHLTHYEQVQGDPWGDGDRVRGHDDWPSVQHSHFLFE